MQFTGLNLVLNRNIQESNYNLYQERGKQFYILQDDVENATITGQALSHFVISRINQENKNVIKNFNRLIKDDVLMEVGFNKTPTPVELISYISAAYSIAFDKDIKEGLIQELAFPIDDELYANYFSILNSII